MDIKTTCAFTGHRNVGDDFSVKKLTLLLEKLIQNGIDTFLNGMARGFDLIAAQCVSELKKSYPDIKLIACVPCPDQDKYFTEEDKKTYASVLENCDEVKLLSRKYYKGCMFMRNRYMVDNCSVLVAYDRGYDGGTDYTVGYAKNKEIEIYIV